MTSGPVLTLPQPGDRIGRYTIGELLGAGGMGAVFVAHDPELDRSVALKLLRPERGDTDSCARLVREAQSLARLEHPAVVSVFEVGESGGQTFIAMEYVRGKTLARWQSEPGRTLAEIVDAYRQAGGGLAAAHAVEIVHRDFKPTNVLRGDDGRVRVLDFGIATFGPQRGGVARKIAAQRVTSAETLTALTRVGDVMGTPAYMAPEQSDGTSVDARSDQYAFCVAFYEALFGDRPFEGDTLSDLHDAKCAGVVRRPTKSLRSVPVALRRTLARGLRPNPDDRWPSMTALLLAIEGTQTRRRWPWIAAGLVATSATAGVVVASARVDCEPAAVFAETWNEDERARLAARFHSSSLADASLVGERVVKDIERWADGWAHAYRDACTATDGEGTDDERVLDARMSCLRRHQSALGSLTSLWLEGDDKVLAEAGRAVAGLPRVEDCSAIDALDPAFSLPSDPHLAEQVHALQRRLGEADALEAAGQYTTALALAREILASTEPLDYLPVKLDAQLSVGRILAHMPDVDQAAVVLEEAVHGAAAIGYRSLEVRAATALLYVVGHNLERDEEGQRWGRHALASYAAGNLDETHRATILNNLASVHFAFGRLDEALAMLEEASEIRMRTLGPLHHETGVVLANRAAALVQAGRLEEAKIEYPRVIEIWEATLGPGHPTVATALNGLAAIHERERNFDAAIPLVERAIEIRRTSLPPGHPELATALETLGSLHLYGNHYDAAERLFDESLRIREAALPPGHLHFGSSYTNGAMLAERRGDHAKALSLARAAATIFEAKLGPTHPYLAYPLTSWGNSAFAMGELRDATTQLERALKIRTDHQTTPAELAATEFGLARAVAVDGDRARATRLANAALARVAGPESVDPDLLRALEVWLAAQ